MGGVRADGARDFAAGGRGEAEEVQRGDAASRKEGAVFLLSRFVFRSFLSLLSLLCLELVLLLSSHERSIAAHATDSLVDRGLYLRTRYF